MIKVDATQGAIVKALKGAGCSVEMIQSATGKGGIPDLLVGRKGMNYLLECKVLKGKREPKMTDLSPKQVEWHAAWRGQRSVVCTSEEAFRVVGLL